MRAYNKKVRAKKMNMKTPARLLDDAKREMFIMEVNENRGKSATEVLQQTKRENRDLRARNSELALQLR